MGHYSADMKRIDDLGLGQSAITDPDSYPGRTPEDSYLLVGDRLAMLREMSQRRLEAWRIDVSCDGETQRRSAASYRPLADSLLGSNLESVQRRVPVVAVGSNAAPAQLVRKFTGKPCSSALPVVTGTIRGIGLAFSGHVSRNGYLPAAPLAMADPDATTPIWVTLLDSEQLAVMNQTEPNYELVVVSHPDGGWILELASGERINQCAVYRSLHGVLDIDACRVPGRLISQVTLRKELRRRVPTLPDALAGWRHLGEDLAPAPGAPSPALSLTAISDVTSAGLVRTNDGLEQFVTTGETIECRYGDIVSSLAS